MVDLPTVGNGIVTSTAPQSSVSRGDIEQNANLMAGAMSKVADATSDIATDMAKTQAANDLQQQKVTLNADGSVSVANPANSLIFGRAGEAYHAAVQAGTIAEHSNVISQEMNGLHQEYETDPGGFKKASDAWKAQYLSQHGGGIVGQAISQQADQLQTQHFNAITNFAGNLDIEKNQKSLQDNIADQKNMMIGLARQPDGIHTTEYGDAYNRMYQSYQVLAANPLFKMPQEQADLEIRNFDALLKGESVTAAIDNTFTKKGKGAAQQELNEAILQNPAIPEIDRNRLYAHGMARLQYLTADTSEKIAAGKEDINLLKTNITGGKIQPTDPAVGMGIAQALSRGDGAGAHELYAAQLVEMQRRGTDTLPLEIQAQLLGAERTGVVNTTIPPEGRALLDHIAGPESAGRYDVTYGGNRFSGFADHPRVAVPITSGPDAGNVSTAAGRYQFIAPTWDAQKAKLGLNDFSPGNQDAAAWDLAQTEYKKQTGKDLLTTLRSGQTADVLPALSGQWSSLPGGRQPAGGRAVAPSVNGGPGFTYEQVQRNPYLISAYVRSVAADETSAVEAARLVVGGVNKAIDAGLAPSSADVALARQKAVQYPEKLGAAVEAMDGRLNSEIVSQFPQPQRDALVAQYREMSNGQDQHHMRIAAAFLDQHEKSEKRLTDLPFTEGAHRGWISDPQPIDFSDPDTLGQALAQRGAMSKRIAVMNQSPPGSPPPAALEGDELSQVQGMLANPDPAVKGRVFNALSALPEDVRNATLAKIGSGRPDLMVSVAAGSMMRAAPDVAASILRGQQAAKVNPEFMPKGTGEETAFSQEFNKAVPASTFSLAARTDASGPYAVAQGMIKARYADLSAQSADASGKLNTDRLQQSVDDVTGGILDHNGGKLIAPVRGMPQAIFDRTMAGVTDADLGNGPVQSHLAEANAALNLTPQEQALYQRHFSNLYGAGGVTNDGSDPDLPKGSRSTLYQSSVEHDGKTYNVPTVWDGKILPIGDALKRVEAEGWDKFPSYGSDDEAEARYGKMHDFMEKDTQQYNHPRDPGSVTTLNGQPVTAAYLQNSATLESVGDGRYYVKLGKNPLRPIYAYQGANTEAPQKFMLDLRNRKMGALPSPMSMVVQP
jgi:muramidase (phage lysozyme)